MEGEPKTNRTTALGKQSVVFVGKKAERGMRMLPVRSLAAKIIVEENASAVEEENTLHVLERGDVCPFSRGNLRDRRNVNSAPTL